MLGGWQGTGPMGWKHGRAKKQTRKVDFAEVCTITITMACSHAHLPYGLGNSDTSDVTRHTRHVTRKEAAQRAGVFSRQRALRTHAKSVHTERSVKP